MRTRAFEDQPEADEYPSEPFASGDLCDHKTKTKFYLYGRSECKGDDEKPTSVESRPAAVF